MPAITRSSQFDLRGYNHVALVCSDMQDTVDFYEGVLGFPLVKTLEMGDRGQHFFFQVTENDGIAFFWFPDVNPAAPGIAGADWLAGEMSPGAAGGLASKSAVGSMHHLSFDVPAEMLDEYRNRLIEAGVEVSEIVTQADDNGDEMIRAFYFRDPDGVVLEFSAWSPVTRAPSFQPTHASDAAIRRTGQVAITT
jgi:catechol 2,3-dioxygenase-like lactoylglutathione lyase family enzyme